MEISDIKSQPKPKSKPKKATVPKTPKSTGDIKVPVALLKCLKPIMQHQSIDEWVMKENPTFANQKPLDVWKKNPMLIKQMVHRIQRMKVE